MCSDCGSPRHLHASRWSLPRCCSHFLLRTSHALCPLNLRNAGKTDASLCSDCGSLRHLHASCWSLPRCCSHFILSYPDVFVRSIYEAGKTDNSQMKWDGKMFEPWPESANDRGNQDCDCDECDTKTKRRKLSRCLLLPSSDGDAGSSIQPPPLASPPLPAQPSAPTAPGAPSTRLTAEAESGRERGQAAEAAAEAAAAAGAGLGEGTGTAPQLDAWTVEGDPSTEWTVEGVKPSAERIYAARADDALRA